MDDITSAFGFWIDHNGQIHDIESFYSTHSAIACRYLRDNPGVAVNLSAVAMQYRKTNNTEMHATEYLMIDRGWIRVCKNIQAKFLGISFYGNCVCRSAASRLREYLERYCCVESIKIDIHDLRSPHIKFYLVNGADISGVVDCVYKNVKRVQNDAHSRESVF